MSEWPDIEAVVIPPSASGVVLLTGAAELVTDAILDLELDLDYVQREVTQDAAGITCVRVGSAGESLEEVQHRIENALVTLIEETSELTSWTSRVRLVEASHDDEEDLQRKARGGHGRPPVCGRPALR